MGYHEFLVRKAIIDLPTGHDPKDTNPMLFDFQKEITAWAIRRGRAAIFADCGLGKTPMQLSWADAVVRHINKPALILAPLAVSKQTRREGEKFGVEVNICRSNMDVKSGINITNYEMLHNFNLERFGAVVLDECFPPDTPIDVLRLDNTLESLYIKDVKRGTKIFNAQGEDYVQETYKRRVKRAVQIVINGRRITSSENHPFFTMHGWRSAQDLQPADCVMATEAAVRLVWEDIHPALCSDEISKVLRSILFSEMEDEHRGTQGEGTHGGSPCENREESFGVASVVGPESYCTNRTNTEIKPHERPRSEEESFEYITEDEAQTFRAWGQWNGANIARAHNEGCSIRELDTGIFYITGQTSGWFSNMLQSRLGESRIKNSYRDRRILTSQQEVPRREEGKIPDFFRVESVKILEQGHPELEKYRDADGHVYFYDIKAVRHPSFSVNGLLVHNSSILKSYTGRYRNQIIESTARIPYRLACTATPAPNDYMELGNHAEFLGVVTRSEMLSMFFINDTSNVGTWRLKGHGQSEFWKWLCSWAVMIGKPSDIGFDDNGFILPELKVNEHVVKYGKPLPGKLFIEPAETLSERREARRETIIPRCEKIAEMVNSSTEPWLVWCGLNDEGTLLSKLIKDAVEVKGADDIEHKENSLIGFANGDIRVMVSKSRIAGFGMNFQICNNMAFAGLSDSYESYYQAIRRCWRFGQTRPVNVHIVTSDMESNIVENIRRKEKDATNMCDEMVKSMSDISSIEIRGMEAQRMEYKEDKCEGDGWTLYLGDSVEVIKHIPDESIHFSIFSPPFASLFTYSNSDRDMGNCRSRDEFFIHFDFLIKELYRVIMSGRVCSVHCMDLPATIGHDGFIGMKDFPGEIIRRFELAGWIYHSRVTIWKDPLIQAVRTKTLSLAHKQIIKDSTRCNQGMADYIVSFRKPGENQEPVSHKKGFNRYVGTMDFPTGKTHDDQRKNKQSHEIWQRYASPVWFDINQTRVLSKEMARDEEDEKHVCPLQLDTIERCLELWSNPGDVVLSPFAGIGSEVYCAVEAGRIGIGIELKESYFRQAIKNLESIKRNKKQQELFV